MDEAKFPQKLTNYLNFRAQPPLKKQIAIWHIVELSVRPTGGALQPGGLTFAARGPGITENAVSAR